MSMQIQPGPSVSTRVNNQQKFDVPLNSQRYTWVRAFIENDPEIKSVTDLGCGNGRFVQWLKSVHHLQVINCVDKDNFLLEDEIDRYFRPGFCEVLFGRPKCENGLDIRVWNADLTIPKDELVADCIVMIEVIEHMFPEDVERATRSIFGYYQPKYVVITTPNREFNHLLRSPDEPADSFRHHDHKFEWTRSEFMQYTQVVCGQYPYSVSFDGVGHLPGSEPFGPCTQIAVFQRHPNAQREQVNSTFECFDLLLEKLNTEDQPVWGYGDIKKGIVLKAEYKIPPEGFRHDLNKQSPWNEWNEK